MKLFFTDLETTGLDPEKHGVTQLAGRIIIDGVKVESFNYKVRPLKGQLVAQAALDTTGKTIEELRTYPESHEIFPQYKAMLARYVDKYDKDDKFFFVGYNAMFDNQFTRKWFENLGDKYFGSWFWYPPVCVMQAAMLYLAEERHLLPNFKLGTVATHMGLMEEGQLHDADFDISLTVKMYDHLVAAGCIRARQTTAA